MPRTKQQHLTWFWVFLLVGIFSAARHKHCHGAVIVSNTLWDDSAINRVKHFVYVALECVPVNWFIRVNMRKVASITTPLPKYICMYDSFDFTRMLQQPSNQHTEKPLKIDTRTEHIIIQLFTSFPRYNQGQHSYIIAL